MFWFFNLDFFDFSAIKLGGQKRKNSPTATSASLHLRYFALYTPLKMCKRDSYRVNLGEKAKKRSKISCRFLSESLKSCAILSKTIKCNLQTEERTTLSRTWIKYPWSSIALINRRVESVMINWCFDWLVTSGWILTLTLMTIAFKRHYASCTHTLLYWNKNPSFQRFVCFLQYNLYAVFLNRAHSCLDIWK